MIKPYQIPIVDREVTAISRDYQRLRVKIELGDMKAVQELVCLRQKVSLIQYRLINCKVGFSPASTQG